MGRVLRGRVRGRARRAGGDAAIAGFDCAAEPDLRDESQDGRQAGEARRRRGPPDGPARAALLVARLRAGGDGAGLAPPCSPGARRLPLRPAGDDPASDALLAAPLPAPSRHRPPARRPRRRAGPSQARALPHRPPPHRPRLGGRGGRAEIRGLRGRALAPPRHRPHLEARRRAPGREGRQDGRGPLAPRDRAAAVPCRIRTALDLQRHPARPAARRARMPSLASPAGPRGGHGIEHRPAKASHPRTNAQAPPPQRRGPGARTGPSGRP